MTIARRSFLTSTAAALACPALAGGANGASRVETLAIAASGVNGVVPRVRVFLPPGYAADRQRYQTLYMLDGQYAFEGDSEGTSFEADRRVARLIATGTIRPTIVVAIDNLGDDRFLQYMPQTIYERASAGVRASVEREIRRVGAKSLSSNAFIEFLQGRLKPHIDKHYRTSPDRLHTAIFGASMAGVMAGAIFVEAQQTFGRGAAMSPNWAIYDERFVDDPSLPSLWRDYFSALGPPAGRRFWLDHGTKMMDAGMVPHQKMIAQALEHLGWERGCHLQTRVYDAGHAFAQTAVQMDEVLAWLLA